MERSDSETLKSLMRRTALGIVSIQSVLESADAQEDHHYDEEWTRDVVRVCNLALNGLLPYYQGARCMIEAEKGTTSQKDTLK